MKPLRGHDYAGGGVYFVTVCVAGRRPLFGTVVNGRVALSEARHAASLRVFRRRFSAPLIMDGFW